MKYLFTLALCSLIAGRASAQTYDTAVDVGGHRLSFHITRGTGMPILFEGGAGANLACWFLDSYVDSITQLRKKYLAAQKDTNWASYFAAMNLPNTVALMRKTPFPANIPAIELVSEINFPDSIMAQRWRECHLQFAAAEPNREDITAYGCGHFIFRDNPPLAISAIVMAYAGAQHKDQADEVMKRYLSYSLEAFDQTKKKKVP